MLRHILPAFLARKWAEWLYRVLQKDEIEVVAMNLTMAGLIDHDEYLRMISADTAEEIIWVYQRIERIRIAENN